VFRIGEFSRIVQLSIRVLRHYDEIGLLIPAHVDPSTGHRSYSAEQLADVNRIIALKGLGISLAQIRKLVRAQVGTAEIIGMLRLETARAEQARADAIDRLRSLEHQLAQLTETGTLSDVTVVEKAVPAMPLLGYRRTVADLDAANALLPEVLAAGAGLRRAVPLVIVAHDTFFDTEELDLEFGFPVSEPASLTLDSGLKLTLGQLPAVDRMPSMVAIGPQRDGHRRCHAALGQWLVRHHCHLAGPGREVIYNADAAAHGPTVEIQYPVSPDPSR
jgi:DNA-binding transcriptional MerR regulator